MDITKGELEKRFVEYNETYFGGRLKKPQLSTFYSRKVFFVGIFQCRGFDRSGTIVKPCIGIARDIDWDDEWLRGILIHEMIHYQLALREKRACGHGRKFMKVRNEIQKKYSIRVPVHSAYRLFLKGEKNPSTRLGLMVSYLKHIIF